MSKHPPIGIDLGTTFSAIAYVDKDGRPISIENSVGEFLTPSCILFDAGEVIIGREASRASVVTPLSFAECFKREMGGDDSPKPVNGEQVPPEVLSALILQQLKLDAERILGEITEAVITVPAFFDERRRNATKTAAAMAGLEVLGIINEPTAAAICYGYNSGIITAENPSVKKLLVYDLGGGTFDVSVVHVKGGRFRTVATDGDVRLGGKDFDERIVNFVAETFRNEHGLDPRSDPEDCAQLWLDAESVKKSLSERKSISTVCHHNGLRTRVEVTRVVFEKLTSDLLSRTELTTELVRKQASLPWEELDHIIMVGGSSRMPMVTDLLLRMTGKQLDRSVSPDQSIAHGAAIYSELLSGSSNRENKLLVTDVNSHTLGVIGIQPGTGEHLVSAIIPKNTPIPCSLTKVYRTATDGQKDVVVRVVEGESSNPQHCILIGECVVNDLPPNLPKGTAIELSFAYEKDGTINISARLPSIRRSVQTQIKRKLQSDPSRFDYWVGVLTGKTVDSLPNRNNSEASDGDLPPLMPSEVLDEMYTKIGLLACENAFSKGMDQQLVKRVEAIQRELRLLDDKLNEYSSQSASGNVRRIQLSTSVAKIRNRMESSGKQLEIAIIDLGIKCFQDDVEFGDVDTLYDKCESLLKASKK
jgi:molecular chaperone DnaK